MNKPMTRAERRHHLHRIKKSAMPCILEGSSLQPMELCHMNLFRGQLAQRLGRPLFVPFSPFLTIIVEISDDLGLLLMH
jgi:hypothetical protein